MVHPIIDEYYSHNPYHCRSSKFVQDKGLVTNEKGSKSSTPDKLSPKNIAPPVLAPISLLHERLANSILPSVLDGTSPAFPAGSPAPDFAVRDLFSIKPMVVSVRDPGKPQELGNIKKKRKELEREPESPPPPAPRTYGDPNKIAQYFPELN